MKKIRTIFAMIILISLTGCSKYVIETEQQNDNAAEYIAGLLLKNSSNYEDALIYKDYKKITEDNEKKDNPNQTAPSDQNDVVPKDTDANNKPAESQKPSNVEEELQVADFYKKYGIKLEYKTHEFCESYPPDLKQSYFIPEAGAGRELLVIHFDMTNLSKEKKKIDLLSQKIKYQLKIGDNASLYKPSMTALLNDLQYLEMNLKGKEKENVVLVFGVEKDIKASKQEMCLYIEKGKSTVKINLNK